MNIEIKITACVYCPFRAEVIGESFCHLLRANHKENELSRDLVMTLKTHEECPLVTNVYVFTHKKFKEQK